MRISFPHAGYWFLGCYAWLLLTNFVGQQQARHFFTRNGCRRHFSILELELPASAQTTAQLVRGIDDLPGGEGAIVKKALRGQLGVDYLFMLGVYPGSGLLCMKLTRLLPSGGWQTYFTVLAWLQGVAWTFDAIENQYILRLLNNPQPFAPLPYTFYFGIVICKWVLAIAGILSAVIGLLCHWIPRTYLPYFRTYLGLTGLFWLLMVYRNLLRRAHKRRDTAESHFSFSAGQGG